MVLSSFGRAFVDLLFPSSSASGVGAMEAASAHAPPNCTATEAIRSRPEVMPVKKASMPGTGKNHLHQSRSAKEPLSSMREPPEALTAALVRSGSACEVAGRLDELHAFGGRELQLVHTTNTEYSLHDERVVQSAMHVAARRGSLEILELLLASRADPNVTNDQWSTPLHLCAEGGHHELAEALVRAGADVASRNSFGRSAKDLARQSEWDCTEVALGKAKIQNLLGNAVSWDSVSQASTGAPRSSETTLSECTSSAYDSEWPQR